MIWPITHQWLLKKKSNVLLTQILGETKSRDKNENIQVLSYNAIYRDEYQCVFLYNIAWQQYCLRGTIGVSQTTVSNESPWPRFDSCRKINHLHKCVAIFIMTRRRHKRFEVFHFEPSWEEALHVNFGGGDTTGPCPIWKPYPKWKMARGYVISGIHLSDISFSK